MSNAGVTSGKYFAMEKFIFDGRGNRAWGAAPDHEISRRCGNNTVARLVPQKFYDDDNGARVVIRLHNTDILTITSDDKMQLRANGWLTTTTAQRINEFITRIGWRQYSESGVWYLAYCGENFDWQNALRYRFADNVIIAPDGTISGAAPDDGANMRRIKRNVTKYVKAFEAEFRAGRVEKPGPGDCFYCTMREVESGAPLGEMIKNTDHLDSHMTEPYFVPALLWRAFESAPRKSQVMQWAMAAWHNGTITDSGALLNIGIQQCFKELRRYMLRQYGFAA